MPIRQVSAVAGVQKHGGEQSKEREFERIFEAAAEREKKKAEQAVPVKKSGFGAVSCCYGKHAMELGFEEMSTFDKIR